MALDSHPLRVVHVNDVAFVGSTIVAGLVAAGIEAELLRPATPGAGWSYPWKAASLPIRVAVQAATVIRLRALRPDVIHIHYATQALPALPGGAPFFVHCHGSDIRGVKPGTLAGRSIAAMMARASAVFVATPDLLASARDLRADARWIPNPIDMQLFAPGEPPSRDLLVGTRLSPIKGVDTAIQIVLAVRQMRPRTTITVVNHGPELRRMLEAAGPGTLVVPPVSHDRMPGLFSSHRLAIGQFALGIVSQFELEAMASGTPVVTRLDADHVYDVQPPVVPAETVDDAVAGIVALLDDDGARANASIRGREWVLCHHDRDSVVAALIGEYEAAPRFPQ